MPTRKQRRRQQKSRRHEYEYVYVDAEGNEVEADPDEHPAPSEPKHARSSNGKPAPARKGASRGRQGRVVEPPSWRRVGRRALFLGPVLIVAMMLLNKDLPVGQRLVPALFMLVFFLPFSYFTDSLAYRLYRRRVDRAAAGSRAGRRR
jgi:hypothetical protein